MANPPDIRHVLIVEDDEPDAILIKRALRKALPGAVLVWVRCVETALQELTRQTVDVALVDWCLPDGLATEVSQACRAFGYQVPIVFMTRGDRRAPARHLGTHAHAFISKNDMSPAKLRATVAVAVARTAGVSAGAFPEPAVNRQNSGERWTEGRTPGSTVAWTWPTATGSMGEGAIPTQGEAMQSARVDPHTGPASGFPRVLVVEDQETDAILVRRALRRALPAATSVRARDVREALAALSLGNTDVALVDWCLPDGLGAEVAERAAVLNPEVPVVLMSKGNLGYSVETARGFISKGDLTPKRLRAVLQHALSLPPFGPDDPLPAPTVHSAGTVRRG